MPSTVVDGVRGYESGVAGGHLAFSIESSSKRGRKEERATDL